MKRCVFLMLSFFLLCCHEPTKEETNIFKCYIGKLGLSKITKENNIFDIVVSTILVNNGNDTIYISWKDDSLSVNYPSSYYHGINNSEQEDCFSSVPFVYTPVKGIVGFDTLGFHARLWNKRIAPQDTVPMVLFFHRYQTEKDIETLLNELDNIHLIICQNEKELVKEMSFIKSDNSKLYYGEDGSFGFKITKKRKGEPYDY